VPPAAEIDFSRRRFGWVRMQTRGTGQSVRDVPRDPNSASTPRFELVSGADEDSLELVLTGDLDMAATFKIEPEVDRLLAGQRIRRLVLDVADVQFIDSAGVGVLLSIRERTKQLGIEMTLVNVSDSVRRILDLSGTSALFTD
jgi:anti-anti-sigma factor